MPIQNGYRELPTPTGYPRFSFIPSTHGWANKSLTGSTSLPQLLKVREILPIHVRDDEPASSPQQNVKMAGKLNEVPVMAARGFFISGMDWLDPQEGFPWNLREYSTFIDAAIEEHVRDGLRRANEGLEAAPEQFRKVLKQSIIRTRMEAQAALHTRRVLSQPGSGQIISQPSEIAAIEEQIVKAVNTLASLCNQAVTGGESGTPVEDDSLPGGLCSALSTI